MVLRRTATWLVQQNRPGRGALTVFIVALGCILVVHRMAPRQIFQAHLPPDYVNFYYPTAVNIASGHGILNTDGEIMVRYPPGFPLIIAGLLTISNLTGLPENVVIDAFIIVCAAGISTALYSLARFLFDQYTGFVAAFLWISYPFAWRLSSQPFSELPFMLVFISVLLILFFACKRRPNQYGLYVFCGVLVGLAMLIRPAALGLGVVLVVVIWTANRQMAWRSRLVAGGLLLLANLIVIMPWQIYANAMSDESVLLSSGGMGSVMDGLTFLRHDETAKDYRIIETGYPADVEAFQSELIVLRQADGFQSGHDLITLLMLKLQTEPITLLKMLALKALRSWYATDSMQYDNVAALIQLPYLVLGLVASGLLWRRDSARRWLLLSVMLVILYFWLMTTAALSILRYMMPAMSLLFIIIAGAAVNVLQSKKLEANPLESDSRADA